MDEIEKNQQSEELEIITILVEQEELNGAALEIANLVLSQGMDVLTDAQRHVYDRDIAPHFSMECEDCGEQLPVCEIADALRSYDRLCSRCRHQNDEGDDDGE